MSSAELICHAKTLGELKSFLEKEFSFLQNQPYTFAINESLVRELQHPVSENDIIALLPPFSGG